MPKSSDTAADLFYGLLALKRTYNQHKRKRGKIYLHPVAAQILRDKYPQYVMRLGIEEKSWSFFRGLELGRLCGWDLVLGSTDTYPWQEEYPVFKTSLIPRLG